MRAPARNPSSRAVERKSAMPPEAERNRSMTVEKIKGLGTGNIYVVCTDEEIVLVDTGIPQDRRLVADRIRRLGRSPAEVSAILLTHFHFDHAGSAAALKRLSGANVYAHEADVPYIQGDETISSVYARGVIGKGLSAVQPAVRKIVKVPPVEVDVPLRDGQLIDVLGGIEVIHAPGHTPGSAAFLWPEQGVLFSGDCMINTYHFLTPPTNGFSVDFDETARSIRKVVDEVDGRQVRMVCPGHGPVVSERAPEKLRKVRGRVLPRCEP